MKKSLLFLAALLAGSSAYAQHYEWTAAQINDNQVFESSDAAVAKGFNTLWGSEKWLGMPSQNLINNEEIVVSLPCPYSYVSTGNNKFSGASDYAYKLILGMNNSTRDGIDPTKFLDGIEGNDYVRKTGDSDQGNVVNDAVIKIDIPEGGSYGKLTFKFNRGNNLGVLYVVDQTKSQQVLLSAGKSDDSKIMTHTASLNVQPSHTYYVISSDKGSVELYAIEYDTNSSDKYATIATEENSTSLWTAAQINDNQVFESSDAAVAKGFNTLWGSEKWLGMPSQNLINNEEIVVSLPCPYSYVSTGNNKFSGASDYAYKLILGMNNSTRDGIDPTKFLDGIEGNDYVRKTGDSDQGNVVNDAILKITIPENGTYGRVILNTNRGNNLGVLYVVDQTKTQQILLSAGKCDDDNIKTHAAIFNVQPNHTYYVMSSDKGSVELYAIGYCGTTSEKYDALNSSTSAITTINSKPGFEKNVMYNILGQRVNGNAKGIVIMNGKKMLVK